MCSNDDALLPLDIYGILFKNNALATQVVFELV